MSMNTEPENFDQLHRLLKLKRYESPPPRYFSDFPGQVLARIRAGNAGVRSESFDAGIARSPWVRPFWRLIEQQPAAAGLCTAAACGLLVIGVFASDNARPTLGITADGMAMVESTAAEHPGQNRFAKVDNVTGGLLFDSSTNPAVQLSPGPSLFGEFPKLGVPQRVNGMPMRLR